ncbi:MAG: hypothetical protein ABGX27_00905 [Desulfurobacteriaceae bacterium]
MKDWLNFFKLFFKGTFSDLATEKLQAKAKNLNDDFLLLILSERIGIPNPMYYYLVEILPYVAKDMKGWNVRMKDTKTILNRIFGELGEP